MDFSFLQTFVMLSGQVADGLTTIFAGELIDRFGHFEVWHIAGSLLVAVSFSSMFGGCLPCKLIGSDSAMLQTIGYSVFAAIFNVGWAASQVSHIVSTFRGLLESKRSGE
ncbi:uncharacterized protein [Solanum lycopersicum]|uniref:uncharacterized protein isoform X2 n=2 Tax=Solanum lycopersicum TaxID=4081 RepID=UPI0037489A37